jgi:aspartyl/asparaginyl beta-hydroxylase (cupin superfamily)
MSQDTPTLWFSDSGTPFRGQEPHYFDNATLPWTGLVESQWTIIRDELRDFIANQRDQLQPYVDGDMASRPNRWRTLGLMFWTLKSPRQCAQFPKTWSILKGVPGILAASFNLLEEQTTIKPHFGNTNAIFRCHLGLQIPAPAPQCGFRVGDEVRSWEEGKLLVFCDAHLHTAWNNSRQDRYVLVMDVMRPEFAQRKLYVASRVLSSIYFEPAYQKVKALRTFCSGPRARQAMFKLFGLYYSTRLYLHSLRRI